MNRHGAYRKSALCFQPQDDQMPAITTPFITDSLLVRFWNSKDRRLDVYLPTTAWAATYEERIS